MLPTPPTPTSESPEETLPPVTSNLSSDAINNFLTAQLGTRKFEHEDFLKFRDVIRRKAKNLKQKKKKKKESIILSDNEASNIMELSFKRLLSTKKTQDKEVKESKTKEAQLVTTQSEKSQSKIILKATTATTSSEPILPQRENNDDSSTESDNSLTKNNNEKKKSSMSQDAQRPPIPPPPSSLSSDSKGSSSHKSPPVKDAKSPPIDPFALESSGSTKSSPSESKDEGPDITCEEEEKPPFLIEAILLYPGLPSEDVQDSFKAHSEHKEADEYEYLKGGTIDSTLANLSESSYTLTPGDKDIQFRKMIYLTTSYARSMTGVNEFHKKQYSEMHKKLGIITTISTLPIVKTSQEVDSIEIIHTTFLIRFCILQT